MVSLVIYLGNNRDSSKTMSDWRCFLFVLLLFSIVFAVQQRQEFLCIGCSKEVNKVRFPPVSRSQKIRIINFTWVPAFKHHLFCTLYEMVWYEIKYNHQVCNYAISFVLTRTLCGVRFKDILKALGLWNKWRAQWLFSAAERAKAVICLFLAMIICYFHPFPRI